MSLPRKLKIVSSDHGPMLLDAETDEVIHNVSGIDIFIDAERITAHITIEDPEINITLENHDEEVVKVETTRQYHGRRSIRGDGDSS